MAFMDTDDSSRIENFYQEQPIRNSIGNSIRILIGYDDLKCSLNRDHIIMWPACIMLA